MKLALGLHLCVLCGWLTVGAQVMPRSTVSCGAAASGSVSFDWLPATPDPTIDKLPSRNDIENQIDKTENALNAMKRRDFYSKTIRSVTLEPKRPNRLPARQTLPS